MIFIGGDLYFLVADDPFISMKYAKNLAEGFGLVWNPGGERVEGFSNPLMTFLMAAIHLFYKDPATISLVVALMNLGFYIASLILPKSNKSLFKIR